MRIFYKNNKNQPSWDDFSPFEGARAPKSASGSPKRTTNWILVPNWDQNPPIWSPFETSRGTFWRSGAHLNKK